MANMADLLPSVVADGTQRHRGQCSFCAWSKILVPGGRLRLSLHQQIPQQWSEERVSSGRGTAVTVDPSEASQGYCLKNKTHCTIVLRKLHHATQISLDVFFPWFHHCEQCVPSVSVTVKETICSPSLQCLDPWASAVFTPQLDIFITSCFILWCKWTCGPWRVCMKRCWSVTVNLFLYF